MENRNNDHRIANCSGESPKANHHIFAKRIYASHLERSRIIYNGPQPSLSTIKSVSMVSLEPKTIEKIFKSMEGNPVVPKLANTLKLTDIRDSFTQTSKTILQLAQIETGQFSPDSLNQSPRLPEDKVHYKRNSQPSLNEEFQFENFSLEGSICEQQDSLSYTRKNELIRYLDNCERYGRIPDSSRMQDDDDSAERTLTETYLKKTKSKKSEIDTDVLYQNSNLPSETSSLHDHRSKFLQQTSPLRNLIKREQPLTHVPDNELRSQSYAEVCHSDYEENEPIERTPPPINRFTVKSVKERPFGDKTQPIKFYYQNEPLEKQLCLYKKSTEANLLEPMTTIELYSAKEKFSAGPIYHGKRSNSFMSPTIASERKSQLKEIRHINRLISPTKRGKSASPQRVTNKIEKFKLSDDKIPYIDQPPTVVDREIVCKEMAIRKSISRREGSPKRLIAPVIAKPIFEEDLLNIDKLSLDLRTSEESFNHTGRLTESMSLMSTDTNIATALNRIKNSDWNMALKGLAEMTQLCRIMDTDSLYGYMTVVNQRLIELLRSPRSHVCRTSCQAAGHFFESMKDTRRPEFDDIVDILLSKTADANKFIRKDANLSLDCMVTHVPTFHAIRAICCKGPVHKNPLVRTASVRLIVCAVVIAGPDSILNPNNSDHTRKRIIQRMSKFLEDKNFETRKYGERLYKVLCQEQNFDMYLKKYLEKDDIARMKKTLKFLNQKR